MKLYKIKKSNIDNKGLYAAKNIKAGRKIINYLKEIDGTLVEIPYTAGISSTSIIKRLHKD